MDEILNYADIVQQYQGNIVLYKGDVVYVSAVSDEAPHKVTALRLIDGKKLTAAFNLIDFVPPNSRLGNVNVAGSVLYVTRKPVRKMNVGINKANLQTEMLPTDYPEGGREAQLAVLGLKSPDLARTMMGQFPLFDECLDYIRSFKGCMAFDRQFAIDSNKRVFYKTEHVADLPKNCIKIERIVFHKGRESLELLIGENCAKALHAVG